MTLLLTACPPAADQLVFVLPDGSEARDATFDFGPRGGRTRRTFTLRNVSEHDVELADATLEGTFVASVPAQRLVVGAQLPVLVEYTPGGEDSATLEVRGARGGALASLTVTGRLEASRCALPDELDFGAVRVGEAAQRTVDFPVLDVRRDVFIGAPGAPWQLPSAAAAGTVSVPAGTAATARALFPAQLDAGAFSATWRLNAGGDCEAKELPLSATVVARALSAAPTTVDFGAVTPPAQPSASATLLNALSREVEVTLEVVAPTGEPTTLFRTGLTRVVLPAATRDATGGWRPGEAEVPLTAWLLGAGTVQGKLVVSADGETLEVPLVARAAGAGLVVTPAPLTLEVPEVGGQLLAVGAGLVARNTSPTATVQVERVSVEAEPGTAPGALCVGAWSQGTCTAPAALSLAPGTEFELPVRLAATGDGPWRWFVVLHTDDATTPELRVEVSARRRPMGDCVLAAPAALRIGPVRAPTPMVHALVLENQGLTSCTVQGLWVEGSPDVRAPSAFVVAPGERRLVDVEYLPTTAPGTSATPTLRFSVNSVAAPTRSVALEVSSDDGCLFLSPEQFDFGAVAPACGARVQPIGLGNRCAGAEVTVNAVHLTGSSAFTLEGTPPKKLAASSFTPDAVRVRFDPPAAGAFTATLDFEVALTSGTRRLSVPLRGLAVAGGRQKDRVVMPGAVDALLIEDASMGAAPWSALSGQAQALLAAAQARGRSIRLGAIEADEQKAGRLLELGSSRWLELGATSPATLAQLLEPGTQGRDVEALRGPGLAALTGEGVTGWNRGFLRRGAGLAVASISNAPDQSTQPASVVLPQLAALKGSQRRELLSWSVVGPASASPPPGCTYEGALTSVDDEYAPARAFPGTTLDVCAAVATPARFTTQVAPQLFGDRDTVFLRAPIEPGALPSVSVGGVAVPELGAGGARNWTWDVTRGAVSFSGLALRAGEAVELEYPTLCPP
ncbi:MAG: choice-of-anchor D domain-containing protein [Myxococcota bacterium]